MLLTIATLIVPILLTPLIIIGLRPLFGLFLREGIELFTKKTLRKDRAVRIGHGLAAVNVFVLLLAWLASFGASALIGPCLLTIVPAVAGMCGALAETILMVRSRVGLVGQPAVLVGLLTFAGGNLPLFLIVPVILAMR